jgi:DNA-binding transcriptional LysR family regulator
MKIDTSLLQSFLSCVESGSVSLAAAALGVTQGAVSQRLQKLEELLGCALLIRAKSGLKLTDAGNKLLRFAHMHRHLESEVLSEINAFQDEVSGTVRIAAYSSVLRSVVIPALAKFLLANKKVSIEFRSFEVPDLEGVLRSGAADFVIADYHFEKVGIKETLLGREKFVVITGAKTPCHEEIYLDHGPNDHATSSFFASQTKRPKVYRRTFMGDVYGIIDGVSAGLGKAVMSQHLVEGRNDVVTVRGYRDYSRDVVLHHFEYPYYPKVWKKVTDALVSSRLL